MLHLTRRPWLACLLGLAALALTPPLASAQVWPNGGVSLPQINNLGAALAVNPYGGLGNYGGAAALASLYANPYGAGGLTNGANGGYGTGGYGQNPYGTYYEDPNGAVLRGSAQVTDSQGRFLLYQQQAYWYREQVRAQRIANDRKRFDEMLYEREKTPTAEDNRRRAQMQSAQRARSAPPVTEIWSGKSLNDILVDLQKHPNSGASAESGDLPKSLDEDGLKRINVAKGASIGLLKNEGQLQWPVALAGSDYSPLRQRLGALARDAVRQAEFNAHVDTGTIRQMALELDRLRQQLRTDGQSLSASEYIEAKGFLDHFADAVRALRQTDVGNYFTGQYALKVNTVAELVKYMTEQGLQFAPALAGDRGAYLALHQALAAYGQSRQLQTAERKSSSPAEDPKGGTY